MQIAPRVSGEVTEVQVADDAVVQAGSPLFTLDARPFDLAAGMKDWPRQVRVGGKVNAVIFADGTGHPTAWFARGLQRVWSWTSYLY